MARLVADVGKSQTRLRIHPYGETVTGPGATPALAATENAGRYLAGLVQDCSELMNAPDTDISEVVVGTTFWPNDREIEECKMLLQRMWPAAEIHIIDDGVLAHAAALSGPGTVASVGTGVVVVGMDVSSRLYLSDGWGPGVGDRGSAYDVGITAIRHFCRVRDGVDGVSLLAERLGQRLGGGDDAPDAAQLFRAANSPSNVAALALVVTEAAAEGDDTSISLLESAARALADTCASLAHRIGERSTALVGRFVSTDPYRRLVEAAMIDRDLDLTLPRGDVLDVAAGVIGRSYAQRARRWGINDGREAPK